MNKISESSLFKFRPINLHTLESLRDNYLYFSSLNDFNDPFDCRLNIFFEGNEMDWDSFFARNNYIINNKKNKSIIKNKLKNLEGKFLYETQKSILSKFRVLSFSGINDEILLWSHYADSHKGICIEYMTFKITDNVKSMHKIIFDEEYVHYQTGLPDIPPNVLYAHEVDYKDDIPDAHNRLRDNENDLRRFILTKYKGWLYEKEYRIFLDKACLKSEKVKLARDVIKGIFFGIRTTKENAKNVETFLSNNDYISSISIFKATAKEGEYSLEFKPYSTFESLINDCE